jgi:hypothetical protein
MSSRPKIFTIFAIALFDAASLAAAQVKPASVLIEVTDVSGNALQGVQNELTRSMYSTTQTLETDAQGHISLALYEGPYILHASRVGFRDRTDDMYVQSPKASSSQTWRITMEAPRNAHVVESVGPREHLLRVSAAPYHEKVEYTSREMKSMPHTSVTIHNAHNGNDETYSGVRLADILRPLGVPLDKDLRGETLTLCLIATGSDGYRVVLSLAEVDPSFHPGEVIVADTYSGEPLGGDSPFRLVVSEDKRPARSVRNLVSIELKSVK